MAKKFPQKKLYPCFPTKYIWFSLGDNDFQWAGEHAARIVVERLGFKEELIPIDHLQKCFAETLIVMCALQNMSDNKLPARLDQYRSYYEDVQVEYTNSIRDSRCWNSEDVYLDTWTGDLFTL